MYKGCVATMGTGGHAVDIQRGVCDGRVDAAVTVEEKPKPSKFAL